MEGGDALQAGGGGGGAEHCYTGINQQYEWFILRPKAPVNILESGNCFSPDVSVHLAFGNDVIVRRAIMSDHCSMRLICY